jgi:hypothetical protein
VRRILFFISMILILSVGLTGAANAQTAIKVLEHRETIIFGQSIEFWALFEIDTVVESVEVLYRPQGALRTLQGQAAFEQNQARFIHYIWTNPGAIPVFSTVEYRYLLTLQSGEVVVTDTFVFDYLDNRYQWQELSDPPFRAHWIEGDTVFGQAVLDSARAGLKKAQSLIAVSEPEALDIYVYPRALEMQQALELNGFGLAAGHANPELRVILVSLPPGATQNFEIQRQIPHEVMHVLLFEKLGDRYVNIPIWLDEGLASLAEATPNPDYYLLLQDAVENNALLPMESLCSGFRLEASLFYLSYAQAESFTRFLYDQYGSSGLEILLEKYADGVDCARGLELAYGHSISRLEENWVHSLIGEVDVLQAIQPLFPWLIVMASILSVPILLTVAGIFRAKTPSSKRKTV